MHPFTFLCCHITCWPLWRCSRMGANDRIHFPLSRTRLRWKPLTHLPKLSKWWGSSDEHPKRRPNGITAGIGGPAPSLPSPRDTACLFRGPARAIAAFRHYLRFRHPLFPTCAPPSPKWVGNRAPAVGRSTNSWVRGWPTWGHAAFIDELGAAFSKAPQQSGRCCYPIHLTSAFSSEFRNCGGPLATDVSP